MMVHRSGSTATEAGTTGAGMMTGQGFDNMLYDTFRRAVLIYGGGGDRVCMHLSNGRTRPSQHQSLRVKLKYSCKTVATFFEIYNIDMLLRRSKFKRSENFAP